MAVPAKSSITDRTFIRELRRSLLRELELYRQFRALLSEQRKWITKFKIDEIELLNQKRSELYRQMQESHAERLELIQRFPDSEGKRLTVLIREHCTRDDAAVLLPLAEELRAEIQQARSEGAESNSVLAYAMNLVNGGISLLWQATQNVSKSYGRNAKVNESFTPRESRSERILKQA